MPALVKDRLVQAWIFYDAGSLVLRGDSTYVLQIDSKFRDFPDAMIDGRHSGVFHWSRETGAIDLREQTGESGYRGSASVDTVRLYCWSSCSVPFPDQPPDFTFVRARN
jgi:hypothetical protein